jgi:hypothetical protein
VNKYLYAGVIDLHEPDNKTLKTGHKKQMHYGDDVVVENHDPETAR